eukprot:8781-Pelagococcus_subviridis.AAC.2
MVFGRAGDQSDWRDSTPRRVCDGNSGRSRKFSPRLASSTRTVNKRCLVSARRRAPARRDGRRRRDLRGARERGRALRVRGRRRRARRLRRGVRSSRVAARERPPRASRVVVVVVVVVDEARSIHWSPYDRVREVDADP